MATVTLLKNASAAAGQLDSVLQDLTDAAKEVDHGRGTFRDLVDTPVNAGKGWSGAGVSTAATVTSANLLSMDTVHRRLGEMHTAVSAFSASLTQAYTWWRSLQDDLPSSTYTVAEDGTVTVDDGATVPAEAQSPEVLTASVREILRYLDDADGALAGRLGEFVTDPLPPASASATPGLEGSVQDAWLAAVDGESTGTGSWDPNWTPMGNTHAMSTGAWMSALGLFIRVFRGGTYVGGGYFTGPDGRQYPIATPQLTRDCKTYTHGAEVEDLGGADTGWQTMGVNTGFAQMGDPPSKLSKALILLGGLAGGDMSPVVGVDPEATAHLTFDEDGAPVGTTEPGASGGNPPGGGSNSYVIVRHDGKGAPVTTTYSAPDIGEKYGVGPGISVVTNGLEAVNAVKHTNDSSWYAYRVEFQQNVDGRTRALYTTYQVSRGPDGHEWVTPYDTYMGEDGKLQRHIATHYVPPTTGPELPSTSPAQPRHHVEVHWGD